jgi:transcriptional regulator with XRE-family HTH domain
MTINPDILIKFGTKLRQYRLHYGITQKEFAQMLGLQHSYVGSLERGEKNISLLKLIRISKVLNISPADLVSEI